MDLLRKSLLHKLNHIKLSRSQPIARSTKGDQPACRISGRPGTTRQDIKATTHHFAAANGLALCAYYCSHRSLQPATHKTSQYISEPVIRLEGLAEVNRLLRLNGAVHSVAPAVLAPEEYGERR